MDPDRPCYEPIPGSTGKNTPNFPRVSYKPFHPTKESCPLESNGVILSDPSSTKNDSNQISISVSSQNASHSQMHRKSLKKKKRHATIFFICIILTLFLLTVIIFSLSYLAFFQSSNDKGNLLWKNQPELSEIIQIPEVHFPSNYFVELYIDLLQGKQDDNYCQGFVQIIFDTRTPADFILLHAGPRQKLKLDLTRLQLSSGKKIYIKSQIVHASGNFLLLLLENVLPVSSNNKLTLRFESLIKNAPFSFALYSLNSSLSSGISTQFQPGFARMVFPCFDEPSYKSTFDMRLHFNQGYMSRSNMPQKGQLMTSAFFGRPFQFPLPENMKTVEFERSPVMPTYLVAFFIVPLDMLDTEMTFTYQSKLDPSLETLIRLYRRYPDTEEERANNEQIELVIRQSLAWCEEKFGKPYTLPKLDFVWVAHLAQGMENWGLVTMKDTMGQRATLMTIIHEVIHQWLGNLVTIQWWSDIWVTEALTRYLEYNIYRNVVPKIERDKYQMFVEGYNSRDGKYPLYPKISSSDSTVVVEETFYKNDVYLRGAWLYTGFEMIVGFDLIVHCTGVFFNKFFLKSVNLQQYLEILSSCTDVEVKKHLPEPIETVLFTWLEKGGMPLVRISHDVNRNLLLQQSPHCSVKETDKCTNGPNTLWKIPIMVSDFNGNVETWEYLDNSSKTFSGYKNRTDFLINYNLTFPLSVDYSPEFWKSVLEGIKNREIDTLQVGIMQGDLSVNLFGGSTSIETTLMMFEELSQEDFSFYQLSNPSVTELLFFSFSQIYVEPTYYPQLEQFMLETADKINTTTCFDQDLGSGRRSDVIMNGCMNYFKYFCRRNMQHCEQMIIGDEIMTSFDVDFNNVHYLSILYEIVSDSKRSAEQTKNYILERVRDYPILTTLLVSNETLPLIMDDIITMFVDECRHGESVIRKFLRFVLSNNPEANFLIAENYINTLANKVFKKQGSLEANKLCYESLTLLNSLLFESSPKAQENIWKQRTKLGALQMETEIVPLILKTSTEKMQTLNREILIEFLDRNYKN